MNNFDLLAIYLLFSLVYFLNQAGHSWHDHEHLKFYGWVYLATIPSAGLAIFFLK